MKKDILILSPLPPPVGGIASWTENLIDYISKEKIPCVIHLNIAIRFKSITQKKKAIRLISGTIDSLILFYKFINYYIKYRPKIVHLTTPASYALFKDVMLSIMCQLFGIKLINHFHFGRIPELALHSNWEWKMIKILTRISYCSIVLDSLSQDELKKCYLGNVYTVPNPCSKEVELIARKEIKTIETKDLIFVGHVIPQKGVFELVESIILMEQNVNLTIVGPFEDSIKEKLMTIAQKKDFGSWLRFNGVMSRGEILELMQKSYALVLPSYSEGFPNVILESLACGCPVISTNVGAIPEMLSIGKDSQCGLCIPIHDIDSLKDSINYLYANPNKRTEFAINGKKKVLENYTMSCVYKQYDSIWNS